MIEIINGIISSIQNSLINKIILDLKTIRMSLETFIMRTNVQNVKMNHDESLSTLELKWEYQSNLLECNLKFTPMD